MLQAHCLDIVGGRGFFFSRKRKEKEKNKIEKLRIFKYNKYVTEAKI